MTVEQEVAGLVAAFALSTRVAVAHPGNPVMDLAALSKRIVRLVIGMTETEDNSQRCSCGPNPPDPWCPLHGDVSGSLGTV